MRHATALGSILLAAFLASGAASGAARPADPAGVVEALLRQPPDVLSGLEAVVGPLHRDPTKWEDAVGPLDRLAPGPAVARAHVELAIDPFHQRPDRVKDPSLRGWRLDFQTGRDACRRLLARRFPNPPELRDGGRRVLRFGSLYYTELDVDGAFRLSWYASEPLFAIPERSEAGTAKLVAGLAAVADAGFARQAIVANLGPLAYDPQRNADVLRAPTWTLEYRPAGAARPERLSVNFKRPLPGGGLLPRLGIRKPAVRSGDVHMQSRHVFDLEKRFSLETGYPLPAVGGYVLMISVEPEGLVTIDEKSPGGPVWSAEGAKIRSISAFVPRRE